MAAPAALYLGLASAAASRQQGSGFRPIPVAQGRGSTGGGGNKYDFPSPSSSPVMSSPLSTSPMYRHHLGHPIHVPAAYGTSSTAGMPSASDCASGFTTGSLPAAFGNSRRLYGDGPTTSASTTVRSVPGEAEVAAATAAPTAADPHKKLKEFLEDAKSVGRVRLIVNTGLGVLESVTTLEKLFYHSMPGKGEYANVMQQQDNVDFHLKLDEVKAIKLIVGQARIGNFSTYTIRIVDKVGALGCSIFVMWKPGTQGDYDDGQVEAFVSLLDRWGEEISFKEA